MVRKNSNLKRAKYWIAVLALVASSVPVLPGNNAWADGAGCIGSDTPSALNNAVSNGAAEVELTLCEGASFENYPYGINPNATSKFTLHLNGNTLRLSTFAVKSGVSVYVDGGTITHNGTDQLFRNDGTGILTLENVTYDAKDSGALVRMNAGSTGKTYIKSGNYANGGSLFSDRSGGTASIEISGGTFNQDVDAYTDESHAAYKNGNVWLVETKLTNDNITAPAGITIKEGQEYDLAGDVVLPEDSTSGLTFYSRNTAVASVDGAQFGRTGMLLGEGLGTTSVAIRPSYDTSLIKNVNVTVETGLSDINVSDVAMLQEDTKTVTIENVYYYDRASGVTYEVVSADDRIQATLNGNNIEIVTGANGKVDAGRYTVTVKALVNGAEVVSKDFGVVVGEVFDDFTLEQADDSGVININEDEWFALSVRETSTMGSAQGVEITGIEVTQGENLMHARENRIAGDKQGAGVAKINVTAKYTSDNGNEYELTKPFDVNVVSVLEKIAVREADDTRNTGVKYGSDDGEESLITFDKDESKELKISVHRASAGVNYAVTSSDTDVANVALDTTTGKFTISSTKAGDAHVTVTVTSKDGSVEKTKEFDVTVNPILEEVFADDIELFQGDAAQIAATVNDDVAVDYAYAETTDGAAILTVREDGYILTEKGDNKSGVAKVTITATDAKGRVATKEITVTVNPVLSSLELKENEITIWEDETGKIEVKRAENVLIQDSIVLSYDGYDDTIISVDDNGNITGLRDGTTVVTVTGTFTAPSGRTFSPEHPTDVVVTVKSRLESITAKELHLKSRDEVSGFDVTVAQKGIEPTYAYEFSDGNIARVRQSNGKILARRAGDTDVTIYATHFGKTVSTTSKMHVYEMTVESDAQSNWFGENWLYGDLKDNNSFSVKVDDKNELGEISYTVDGAQDGLEIDVDAGTIVAKKAGEYVVTFTDAMADENATVVGTYEVHVKVYDLKATAQDEKVVRVGEKFEYEIDASSYNIIETQVEFEGSVIETKRGLDSIDIDTNNEKYVKEGEYTVTIRNISARNHGLGSQKIVFTFYVVAPEENEFIIVKSGDEAKLTTSSSWEINVARDVREDTDVEVEADGKTILFGTTDLELGVRNVLIAHEFEDGTVAVLKRATILIYDVEADAKTDEEGITAQTLEDFINQLAAVENPEDAKALADKAQRVFGDRWLFTETLLGLSMLGGQKINTRVAVTEIEEEEVADELLETVAKLNIDGVTYYDVSVLMETENGLKLGQLHELSDVITVALAKAVDPETGYMREYIVIRQHGDQIDIFTEGDGFRIVDGVIYVDSDKFSTYAVAYADTLIAKAPNTGAKTEIASSSTASAMTAVLTLFGLVVMIGAVKLAKKYN